MSEFELFVEGDDLYAAMVRAIDRAEQEVRMESFIFAADEVGERFVAALSARARAGVSVRLHLDQFGAGFPAFRSLEDELQQAGVAFRWYHPFRWRHPLKYRRRNHRKLLVVDERSAFLGGFNIRRLNSRALSGEVRQRDTHVGFTAGELVRTAAALFDAFWNDEPLPSPEDIPDHPSEVQGALLVPSYSRRCAWRLACLHAGMVLHSRHVLVTSPYFGPGTVVEDAMRAVASRGIDVRLLLPRRGDPPAAGWATRAAYEPLLASGVRIFEYQPRKLHAKSMVVDADWAVVGSANLDYISLFVNHELVLVARDRHLAQRLKETYERDLEDAQEVSLSQWRRRGLGERALEGLGHIARRLL